ncbi:YsnF/AvaK domain-containing protein [Modestobacter sp. VKM Ac-2986]|uniref:YsnF/AvaK domain-containing protein n=1 Tax=Modestobacter sp. VKM Ac-2986 TaxID=3004140 RepID=UPI0022AABCF8|nr:YsnF/AvaK domain-containing protein [Modestobacter sp. VKM Ac-2986]MCZ2827676.1 YsnF/AvaK domain-containing protein [Modestobacter sp. VKM Ac-2986]
MGTITTVFLDDVTGQPTWVGLTSGQHAAPQSDEVPVIAPVTGSELSDGRLRLTVSADAVQSAPRIAQPDRLTPAEETMLREHYRGTSTQGTSAGLVDDHAAHDLPRTAVGTLDDTGMTLSEEQIRVDTVVEPWTRAVLRIEEFTEEVMVPVTVTRQRARIDHLPITAHTGGTTGGLPDGDVRSSDRSTSTSGWVTLYTEEPQVTMQRVPVERVRLATSWVTEDSVVTDQVRREHVELTTSDTV